MPVFLAIETSQRIGGVALRDGAGQAHVEMLRSRAEATRHDDDLLPAIDRLFARAGATPSDMQAVGVSIGPGGFTGLRIAVSTAKMFAEALGAKTVAVPSAAVVAESAFSCADAAHRETRAIIVALASKGPTFWSTRLERTIQANPTCWSIVGEPGLADASAADLGGIDAVVGDEFVPAELRERCRANGIALAAPAFDPRACLAIAERMLSGGQVVDPLRLAPLYPRPPEAVTLWEQRPQTGAVPLPPKRS